MSDPVSPLGGAVHRGLVGLRDAGPRGMIQLRGDLSARPLRQVATSLAGVDFPKPGEAQAKGGKALLWMSPDELLLLLPRTEAAPAVSRIAEALAGTHHLAADISDARALIALEGSGLRDLLAKLTPADLSPEALPPGRMRRTRLAQAAAGFWLTGPASAELICFRSQAGYVWDLLVNANRPEEAPGHFAR